MFETKLKEETDDQTSMHRAEIDLIKYTKMNACISMMDSNAIKTMAQIAIKTKEQYRAVRKTNQSEHGDLYNY